MDIKIEGGKNLLWAEQRCGGNSAAESNKKIFEDCVKKELKKLFKPYIDENYNGLVFNTNDESLPDGDRRIQDCSISGVSVKYLGNQPICIQSGKCFLYVHKVLPAHGSLGEIEPKFFCTTSSAQEGCSKNWQNCATDPFLEDEVDYEKCLTEKPGKVKPGCPQIKNTSTSPVQRRGSNVTN